MSDTLLRLIPDDPALVPSSAAIEAASQLLAELVAGAAGVTVQVKEHAVFVDPGSNFERVRCPACGAEITEWWFEAMDRAARPDGSFEELQTDVPCCARRMSLNDLTYEMPAGFARVIIEARDPQVSELSEQQCRALSAALGGGIRIIHARV